MYFYPSCFSPSGLNPRRLSGFLYVKGVRQEDPPFLSLVILVIEALSGMVVNMQKRRHDYRF